MHISQLPVEIIGHTIDLGTDEDIVSVNSVNTDDTEFKGPYTPRAVAVLYPFPRPASMVCKKWRTIILGDVRLRNVELTLLRYQRLPNQLRKLAQQIMAIVPSYDYHIVITDKRFDLYQIDEPSFSDRLRLVTMVSSSLRSLRLRLGQDSTSDLEKLLDSGFPKLKMLGIDGSWKYSGLLSLKRASLPCLDHLLLNRCQTDLTCTKGLRPLQRLSLTGSQCSWERLQDLIDSQTSLESLELDLDRAREVSFPGILNPASNSLNLLTSLRLSYSEGLIGNFILRYNLPNLQILAIEHFTTIYGEHHVPVLPLPDTITFPNLRTLQLPLTDFSFNIMKHLTLPKVQTLALMLPCLFSLQDLRDDRKLCMPKLRSLIIDDVTITQIENLLAAFDPAQVASESLQQLILRSIVLDLELKWSKYFTRLKFLSVKACRGDPGDLDDLFAGAKEMTQVEFEFDGIQNFTKMRKLLIAGFSGWIYPSRFIITSSRPLKDNQRRLLAKALCDMVKRRVQAKLPLRLLRLHMPNAMKMEAEIVDPLSKLVQDYGGRFARSCSMRPRFFDWTSYTADLTE